MNYLIKIIEFYQIGMGKNLDGKFTKYQIASINQSLKSRPNFQSVYKPFILSASLTALSLHVELLKAINTNREQWSFPTLK